MPSPVCVVLTARPSWAKVKPILDALSAQRTPMQLVVCGSALLERYGRVIDQIPAETITERVYAVLEGETAETMAAETGLLGTYLAATFARLKPGIVLTVADRHETLATAMAASYQGIRLAHLQGGERTGSIDDKVRDAVSMLADVHLPATDGAAKRLSGMGVRGTVTKTGCPALDLCRTVPRFMHRKDGPVVVMQHPVTDEAEASGAQMAATIEAVRRIKPYRTVWYWPGEDAGSAAMAKALRLWQRDGFDGLNVQVVRTKPPREFLTELASAAVLVGNSSAGIREASCLGTPVVNIGTRQQHRERASNVVDVAHDADAITEAIRGQFGRSYPMSDLYGDGHAADRVARELAK